MKTEKRIAKSGEYVSNNVLVARVDRREGTRYVVTFVRWLDPARRGSPVGETYMWDIVPTNVLTGKSALKAKIADLEMQLKAANDVAKAADNLDKTGGAYIATLKQELDSVRKAYNELRSAAVYVRRSDYDRQVERADKLKSELENLRSGGVEKYRRQRDAALQERDETHAKLSDERRRNGELSAELGRLRAAVKDARKDIVSTVDRTLTAAATGPKGVVGEWTYYARDNSGLEYRTDGNRVEYWSGRMWFRSGDYPTAASLKADSRVHRLAGPPAHTGPKDEEPRYYKWHTCRYRVSDKKVELWDVKVRRWVPTRVFVTEDQLAKHFSMTCLPGKPADVD